SHEQPGRSGAGLFEPSKTRRDNPRNAPQCWGKEAGLMPARLKPVDRSGRQPRLSSGVLDTRAQRVSVPCRARAAIGLSLITLVDLNLMGQVPVLLGPRIQGCVTCVKSLCVSHLYLL